MYLGLIIRTVTDIEMILDVIGGSIIAELFGKDNMI